MAALSSRGKCGAARSFVAAESVSPARVARPCGSNHRAAAQAPHGVAIAQILRTPRSTVLRDVTMERDILEKALGNFADEQKEVPL